MVVHWLHVSGSGDQNGIASWRLGSEGGGDVIAAGGYVAPPLSPSEESNGASARGLMPMVITAPVRDNEQDEWDMLVGFAVPQGVSVRGHLWAVTA